MDFAQQTRYIRYTVPRTPQPKKCFKGVVHNKVNGTIEYFDEKRRSCTRVR